MSHRYARILIAGCAAVLATTMGAAAALAAARWTVQPGGPVSVTSGRFTMKDTETGAQTACPSARMRGALKSGSGLPGTGIGSITSAGFPQCGNGVPAPPIPTATGLPWHVNVASYNATEGVVTGSLSHVQIKIAAALYPCAAVINGTSGTAADGMVKFRYADSTGQLRLLTTGANLHFYHVQGCAGLLNSGDPATLSATFTMTPAQTIKSP